MRADQLFLLLYFGLAAIVGLGAVMASQGQPLVEVHANIDAEAVMRQAQEAIQEAQEKTTGAIEEYRQLASDLREKVRQADHALVAIEEAARLLEGQSQVVIGLLKLARWVLITSLTLIFITAIFVWRTWVISRTQLIVTQAYTEVDLRQQRSLWQAMMAMLRRMWPHNGAGDDPS